MRPIKLGKLIAELEAIENKEAEIRYDFVGFYPSLELNSWRGDYSMLALGYIDPYSASYDSKTTVGHLLEVCKSVVGSTFRGYKGGDYKMSKKTPVWVASYGQAGNTGITGITDLGYVVIIDTAYCEY